MALWNDISLCKEPLRWNTSQHSRYCFRPHMERNVPYWKLAGLYYHRALQKSFGLGEVPRMKGYTQIPDGETEADVFPNGDFALQLYPEVAVVVLHRC
jgi:hypothetical protein